MCVDTVYTDNCSWNINKTIYTDSVLMNVVVDRLNSLISRELSGFLNNLWTKLINRYTHDVDMRMHGR